MRLNYDSIREILNIKRILIKNTNEISGYTEATSFDEYQQSLSRPLEEVIKNMSEDEEAYLAYITFHTKLDFYLQIKSENISTQIQDEVQHFLEGFFILQPCNKLNIHSFLQLLIKYKEVFTNTGKDVNWIFEIISNTYYHFYKDGLTNFENLVYLYALELEVSYLFKSSSSDLLNRHLGIFSIIDSSFIHQHSDLMSHYYILSLMGLMFIYDFTADQDYDYVSGIDPDTLRMAYNIFEAAENYYAQRKNIPFEEIFNYSISQLSNKLFSLKLKQDFDFNRQEMSLILNLYDKCKYYRYSMSVDQIVFFLKQFSKKSIAISVLKILTSKVMFFRLNHLSELIEKSLNDQDTTNYHFSIFGDHGGSSSILNYLVSHSSIKVNESNFLEFKNAYAQKDKTICFIDDCLLSGTQATEILDSYQKNYKLQKRKVVFVFAIAMDKGIKKLKKYLEQNKYKNYKIYYGTLLHGDDKALEHGQNHLYNNKQERTELKSELSTIGFNILEKRAKEKGWNSKTQKLNSLGYGNQQKLIVFEYGIPKSTLTFLWEEGIHNKKPWIPLFQHYKH